MFATDESVLFMKVSFIEKFHCSTAAFQFILQWKPEDSVEVSKILAEVCTT